jgi:quercetin dioxygenase-like cupin family protein
MLQVGHCRRTLVERIKSSGSSSKLANRADDPSTIEGGELAVADIPMAKALRPLDLVGYQEGAVVSRTLLKQATGTVTAFAFDQGQSLSEHTAPFDALAHVLEGDVDVTIAGTVHHVSAGEMILMPAHQPHAVVARTAFKMVLTMIRSV